MKNRLACLTIMVLMACSPRAYPLYPERPEKPKETTIGTLIVIGVAIAIPALIVTTSDHDK